jgi:hypothetical protein
MNEIFQTTSSIDTHNRIITFAIILLLAAVFATVYYKSHSLAAIVIGILLVVAFPVTIYISQPDKLSITDTYLVISSPLRDQIILISDIQSARVFYQSTDGEELDHFWGGGGVFGQYGRYASTTINEMSIQVKRSDHWILIETKTEKIVIAPDNLQFLEVLQEQIKYGTTNRRLLPANKSRRDDTICAEREL